MSDIKKVFIPPNVIQKNKILGIKKKNLIEGAIWAFIAALIINQIPFTLPVKIIFIVCIGIALLALNAIGINGYSISAAAIAFIRYRRYVKKYTYRRISDETKKPEPLFTERGEVRTAKENRTISAAKKFLGN